MALKFLVATDFSTRSDRALRRACLLARQLSAGLVLVHAVDDDQPERLIEARRTEAGALLDETARTICAGDGIDCESRVVLGVASAGIVDTAEELTADLIVIGPHRREVLRNTFFGTTAERAIRTSRRPVLMTNGVPTGPYRHVLLSTDLSECSLTAAQAAKQLGLLAAAEITALHVLEPEYRGPVLQAAMTVEESEARIAEAERRAKDELGGFLQKLGVVAARRVVVPAEESTAMAIGNCAQAAKADLIVLGTHGRSGFEKWLLGSVAEAVLSDAAIDVLAVPPRRGA